MTIKGIVTSAFSKEPPSRRLTACLSITRREPAIPLRLARPVLALRTTQLQFDARRLIRLGEY